MSIKKTAQFNGGIRPRNKWLNPPAKGNSFSKNVFINCPFDDEYVPLLRAMLFTILYLDHNPRIASERFDSGEARINKIQELIEESRLSIHDISRMQATNVNEFYRLNMPLELGLDIGCRLFKEGVSRSKKCLILVRKRYTHQKALSDLSNSDVKEHDNDAEKLVRQVRNWFSENEGRHVDSATRIWTRFNEFMADFFVKRKEEGFEDKDLEMMPIPEFVRFINEWLRDHKT